MINNELASLQDQIEVSFNESKLELICLRPQKQLAKMSRKSGCFSHEAILKAATVEVLNEGYKCGIQGCSYVQKTWKTSNFVRHFKTLHPRDYNLLNLGDPVSEEQPPEKKKRSDPSVSVAISKVTFIGALVKLVTIHCLPFASMMWNGLRDIINPLSKALNVVINSHNIRDYVDRTSQNIKQIIKTEVEGKFVCFKVDAASKLYRSVLGVNCQYVLDGQLVKRTLGNYKLIKLPHFFILKLAAHYPYCRCC